MDSKIKGNDTLRVKQNVLEHNNIKNTLHIHGEHTLETFKMEYSKHKTI